MAELTLERVAALAGGRIVRGAPDTRIPACGIDSRLIPEGGLFFAVRGGRDGHDFVADAARRGAAGAVVSRLVEGLPSGFGLVMVDDPAKALERLAAAVLRERRRAVKVVGITGSVGKTTTKEFTAALLGRRFKVMKSSGNFNNNLGLSLSLLALAPEHDAVVLEMGMSSPGEILGLTRIASPDVAVITNVNPVHLGFFKSLDEIALAKKEILDGAAEGAVAVLNGNDGLLMKTVSGWKGRRILFGSTPECDVRAEDVRRSKDGTLEFTLVCGRESGRTGLRFLNRSAVEDLTAATGAAMALGLGLEDILPAIEDLRPAAGRGLARVLPGGVTLYDDSYNSSPKALEAALTSLAEVAAGRRVAVLADMLELGSGEADFHREAGRVLARGGWDILVTVGPLAALIAEGASSCGFPATAISLFPDAAGAAARINEIVRSGDLVLVKGSHGMHADIISDALVRGRKE